MFTRTAQDWTRRSRKERLFIPMKRKAVRQILTKELTQLKRIRTQIGTVMITSQAIAVMITGRLGAIHNIVKLRNVAQLKILTGRI